MEPAGTATGIEGEILIDRVVPDVREIHHDVGWNAPASAALQRHVRARKRVPRLDRLERQGCASPGHRSTAPELVYGKIHAAAKKNVKGPFDSVLMNQLF